MELLVLRHGRALTREEFQEKSPGADDGERPLTTDGMKRLKKQRNGIKLLVPDIDIFAYSPFVRARETWKMYDSLYPRSKKEEWNVLTPDHSVQTVLKKIRELTTEDVQSIAVVGHEPQLSQLISFCIFAQSEGSFELRKGGAALIKWEGGIRPGKGQLQWLLTSAQLLAVARGVKHAGL